MTVSLNPSDDFADACDGLVSVTLKRPGSSRTSAIPHALRRTLRTRQIDRSLGRYTANDVTWHLPVGELAESPKAGEVILDEEDVRWTILDVRKTTMDTRWKCVCRNLSIVHGLDTHVDIEKAGYTKSTAGADVATWRLWKAGLPAKIHPAQVQVGSEPSDRRTATSQFVVYLLDDVVFDHTHRIKGPDGTVYRLLGSRRANRIDALMEVDVVRVNEN